jgi:hypothetical protein
MFYEDTVITGERTFMPLGVDCTYDSPDDAIGPQTVVNSNWPATVIWLASVVLAVCGAALLVNPDVFSRRRLGANAWTSALFLLGTPAKGSNQDGEETTIALPRCPSNQ